MWDYLHERFGHVSWERLVSGPGLAHLYEFLRDSGRGVEQELVNRRSREYHAQLGAAGMQVASADAPAQERVAAAAQETGDAGVLSPVDAQLLALALERDATLITDDFAMQHVAAAMGIAWMPVETVGIAKQLRWRWTCSGCRQKWDEPHGECPTCGSALRRTRR